MKKLIFLTLSIMCFLSNISIAQLSIETANNIRVASGKSLYLGGITDNDEPGLRIYHTGTSSIIQQRGSGGLFFLTDASAGNTSRLSITNTGNIGIGTNDPGTKLEVRGKLILDDGDNAVIFTGNGSADLNRYLLLINSTLSSNASGLKAGGILVADSYAYANPGENDLIIKGRVGIGTSSPSTPLQVNGAASLGLTYPISDDTHNLGLAGIFTSRWKNVYATSGMVNTSDRRQKSNIKEIGYGLKEVLQLKPVRYTWKNRPESGEKLGLIAQDVQKVLKEVVKDFDHVKDSTGNWKRVELDILGIYYSDIIPVLVAGIQEQQEIIETEKAANDALTKKVDNLEQELTELKALVQQLVNNGNTLSVPNTDSNTTTTTLHQPALLHQNQPNPFNTTTTIQYDLPQTTSSAFLQITDQKGQVIKSIPLTQKGNGQVELKSGTLAAGTYFYSLIVDEQVVDSKQMVLTK